MIRLNDKYNSRVNENDINWYGVEEKEGVYISIDICGDYEHLFYETKEARDKDIELLDKIFDVKSIEDKANAYPHEVDALKFAMSDIKKEFEPVKEEYITWDEVKNSKKKIKVKMPNGDNRVIFCDDGDIIIARIIARNDYREGRIYKEDLFNALKLKKVE
jgi:hypothetical protein